MECKDCKCTEEVYKIVEKYKNIQGGIMGALHEIQNTYGYISDRNQKILSTVLKVPMSDIYGIITFYNRFSLEPKGKYNIQICMRYSMLCKRI